MKLQTIIHDERLASNIDMLGYATSGSAAIDLYACIENDYALQPGETILVSAGMSIYIEDPGYCGIILPRSGLGHKHGVVLGNTAGLIDSDYQGVLMVSLYNRSNISYTIEPMQRIAQLMIMPVVQIELTQVTKFVKSHRGSGGFGSTGI